MIWKNIHPQVLVPCKEVRITSCFSLLPSHRFGCDSADKELTIRKIENSPPRGISIIWHCRGESSTRPVGGQCMYVLLDMDAGFCISRCQFATIMPWTSTSGVLENVREKCFLSRVPTRTKKNEPRFCVPLKGKTKLFQEWIETLLFLRCNPHRWKFSSVSVPQNRRLKNVNYFEDITRWHFFLSCSFRVNKKVKLFGRLFFVKLSSEPFLRTKLTFSDRRNCVYLYFKTVNKTNAVYECLK